MGEPRGTTAGPGEDVRQRLLGWLGLPGDATDEDIEVTHERLVQFLGTAPLTLQPWARSQVDTCEAARAVLTGQAAADAGLAGVLAAGPAGHGMDETHFDEDAGAPAQGPGARKARASVPGGPLAGQPGGQAGRRGPFLTVLVVVLIIGVVVGVYFMGGGGQDPSSQAASGQGTASAPAAAMGAAPVPVDEAKAAALTARVRANPKDTAAMSELGTMYYRAADFASAATWQSRILDVKPADTNAMLALGTAKFNSGDIAEAERQWRRVLTIDPENAEAHYDLGFLQLSKNPPDLDAAEAEWAKVAELAPGSEIARTAANHIARLRSMPPAASSGSPSSAPATTPAGSASPAVTR